MSIYSLECQELALNIVKGLNFPYLYILLSAKNLPLRAALSMSTYSFECQELVIEAALFILIYSLECQEHTFEGCTFHIYLFS